MMLLLTIYTYSDPMVTNTLWIANAFLFGSISYIIHTIQDYFTSRAVSKLFAKKDYHNGFVMIEVDQLLHYLQLFLTYHLIYH